MNELDFIDYRERLKGSRDAVVFPGQGSQWAGMGKDFYEGIPISRETFEEASDILGWDVPAVCFEDDPRLDLTEYTQLCILTTEIAMFRGLRCLFDFYPSWYGGHSLGEFAALVAAGVLSFSSALQIVQVRAMLMQNAAPTGMGSMSAIISDDLGERKLDKALCDLPVDVANINSRHQVVLSGCTDALPKALEKVLRMVGSRQDVRSVPLNVSAPFHSRFMRSIEEPFKDTLQTFASQINGHQAQAVLSNYTGQFHSKDSNEIIKHLVLQLSGTVQWLTNMENLVRQADIVFEVGPGRPLKDFFKTVGVDCCAVTTFTAATRIFRDKHLRRRHGQEHISNGLQPDG